MNSPRFSLALLTLFSAACSGKSASVFLGSSGAGPNGASSGGSNATGGSTGTSGSSGNVTSFCVLGAQGCPCDSTGSCASGLSCDGNTCCDSSTGSCEVPANQGSSGTSAGGGTPTSGTGGGAPMSGTGGAPANPKDPNAAGSAATSVCTPGTVGPVITDCGYPYASDNPLTNIDFNESDVLRAIAPSGGAPLASVRVFYNDEHALTLGVRSVSVKSSSGTAAHDFTVSELTDDPGAVRSPLTGTNDLTGDDAGIDPVGRPMWPALFVTDTTTDPNARSGDWQMGGTAWNPSAVFGTWKAAVRSVDTTATPNASVVTPDADPAKNDWNLGGGDPLPSDLTTSTSSPAPMMGPNGMMMGGPMGMSGPKDEGYGAEVRWDLVLVPGHSYRIQVMVHDGDQNQVGGDSGEACVNFCAAAACPDDSMPCSTSSPCPVETESICVNGCCI